MRRNRTIVRDRTQNEKSAPGLTNYKADENKPICKIVQPCERVDGGIKCSKKRVLYPKGCKMTMKLGNQRMVPNNHTNKEEFKARMQYRQSVDTSKRQEKRVRLARRGGDNPKGRTPVRRLLNMEGMRRWIQEIGDQHPGNELRNLDLRRNIFDDQATKDRFRELSRNQPFPFETFRELLIAVLGDRAKARPRGGGGGGRGGDRRRNAPPPDPDPDDGGGQDDNIDDNNDIGANDDQSSEDEVEQPRPPQRRRRAARRTSFEQPRLISRRRKRKAATGGVPNVHATVQRQLNVHDFAKTVDNNIHDHYNAWVNRR